MSLASLNDVRVSVLIRYVRIKLNYKLYFRVDIALDSISNIPGVAELVDASDSRSDDIRVVQVQVLSPVLFRSSFLLPPDPWSTVDLHDRVINKSIHLQKLN